MARRIKLLADYHCHPLWSPDDPENVDPAALPLTAETQAALRSWADAYDATLDLDDPASAGFAGDAERAAFDREGARLAEVLRHELGPAFEVSFAGEEQLAEEAAVRLAPATPPDVSSTERARLRQLFGRVLEFEAGCDAETHVRSFVGSPDGAPAGVAWLPPGLPAVPHLDHKRVVELAGPRGQPEDTSEDDSGNSGRPASQGGQDRSCKLAHR